MWIAAVWVALGLLGCRASDLETVSIRLISPADNAVLSPANDEDPTQAGVQVGVQAQVSGVGQLAAIALLVDRAQVALSSPDIRGRVVFPNVTLPPGRHELIARTVTGSVQSAATRYTLQALTITDPTDGAVITASADEDPSTPDTQRSVRVRGDGLALMAAVSLRVDDMDVAELELDAEGSVVFPRQTFTPGTHTLQAVAGDIVSERVSVTVNRLCPRIDLVTPFVAPGVRQVVLGPQQDALGPSCGDEYGVDFSVASDAGDGAMLTLIVNGSVRATARVEGTIARFGAVVLGNRGNMPNRVAFEQEYEGTTCRSELGVDLLVDCEGVSCAITSPAQQVYLNASLDTSLASGFQGEFQVTTDLSAAGQPVVLIVDGDVLNAQTTLPTVRASSAVATFTVALSEGPHRLLAVCTDENRNVTLSGEANWIVDTVPCDVAITSPRAGAYLLETDDVDDSLEGTQIHLMASVVGGDCERSRAAVCDGLTSLPLLPISGTVPAARVTLSTAASQSLCFEVADRAGNLSRAQTQVFYESAAPRLSIRTPSNGSRFNVLGNDQGNVVYQPDLSPLTPACDVLFEVQCSDLETDVTLHEYVSGVAIPNATAPCDPASAPTLEYPGVARFDSVALPRLATVAVIARQAAAGGRLVGVSSPITLIEDCEAPVLMIGSSDGPLCGAVLGPSLSGSSSGSITRDVIVETNDPVGVREVRLRVVPVTGGAPIAELTDTEAPFLFDDVNFSAFGDHDVVLSARDQAGNAAVVPSCRVSVVDAPALTLDIAESSDDDDVIDGNDDCSADPGLQIAVSGTTNAPHGTTATITVAGVTRVTTVMCVGTSCTFSACIDAPQGQILVRAQVTDPSKPTSGVVERQVIVDSLPPLIPFADLVATAPPAHALRAGNVTFRWTDVADQGGIALVGYQLRCANDPITDESDWNAATEFPLTLQPGAAGAQRSVTLAGFRLYEIRDCLLRGVDAANAATPITGSSSARVDFLALRTRTFVGDQDTGLGRAAAAVGDVNGDGMADFLVGGAGLAKVYFGQSDLTQDPRTLTIVGGSDGFGEHVAGLGDINGDGVADFAIAEPDAAVVYVFLGRHERRTNPDPMWPDQLDALIDTPLTLRSAGDDRFGATLAAAGDVNDDGIADFVIGAPEHNDDAGRIHVVLGRTLCTSEITSRCWLLGSTATLGAAGGSVDGFVITGEFGVRLGTAVAGLGDLNGDSHDDLAIGASGSVDELIDATLYLWAGVQYADSDAGMVAVSFLDQPNLRLAGPEMAGQHLAALRSEGGARLAIARDNEIAIASITDPFGTPTLSLELSVVNDVGTSSDAFGSSIGAGFLPSLPQVRCDLDGDQLDELFVGSAGRNAPPGASELFYRTTLRERRDTNQAVQRSTAELVTRASHGFSIVACVGDVNGDGDPDLLAGSAANADNAGAITLFY